MQAKLYWGMFNCKFLAESSKRTLQIGQHLPKLLRVEWHAIFDISLLKQITNANVIQQYKTL